MLSGGFLFEASYGRRHHPYVAISSFNYRAGNVLYGSRSLYAWVYALTVSCEISDRLTATLFATGASASIPSLQLFLSSNAYIVRSLVALQGSCQGLALGAYFSRG